MTGLAELFLLFKRDFWALFGAIWLLCGVGFLVIGGGLALAEGSLLPLAAGVVITAVGGTVVRRAYERIRLEQYLRREGRAVEGEVIAVEQTRMRYNGRFQWRLTYRYADGTGEQHRGQSGYLEPDEAAEWKVGDAVLVRIDPSRPARSVWVGRPEESPT
ncbi:MAG: DUF3592 domain-containing protein [Armatimonadota bacterium]|nr:DUF3592 domain-containing protein [Armatimonadota bacterium]MDR7451392.1 DUF3592 domain-containing protein [Armatimonadota bacterium]MDR7466458.1 DUF3592 domain-containing protein [Armatimonadota bacterium]MDR7493180.1 DUF3592 domain-containing protein [Armatimonadota bacterium]MDR7499467.1 DUF3592 domain-containing protein [Armatimonadota bacterium]